MKNTSPKIGIYAGSGTSHSWLWFVDLFEAAEQYNLAFLDEGYVRNNDILPLDVLIISGGDTFAVAKTLGKTGGLAIKAFVERGGVYIGSCAGAYLPMKSSKKPLDLFNFVDVKITNLSKTLPIAEQESCKFFTTYGCDFVFHPVREAVALETTSYFNNGATLKFNAPLYGGPGMDALDPSWVLAVYKDFTAKTAYLSSRETAHKTLIQHGAVVRVPFGKGCFYLLGPHLEHPGFNQANQFIMDAVIKETQNNPISDESWEIPDNSHPEGKLTEKETKKLLLSIRRELSNSRIVASNLEFLPVQWLIGKKVYEPLKVRVYLESMWKRLLRLEKEQKITVDEGLADRITTAAERTTLELRKMKQQLDRKQDSLDTAIIIFEWLHALSIAFFELYFQALANGKKRSGRIPPGGPAIALKTTKKREKAIS